VFSAWEYRSTLEDSLAAGSASARLWLAAEVWVPSRAAVRRKT
jgi:hypothetical protein